MQSFRTELENPIVEKDIIDLEQKIRAFREGKIHDEKFRSLRLARGVYGQRQPGVQMVRIKLPFGKITFKQLLRIADISDEYASRNLHLTTRQDIQIHYVSLDRTPQLWADLEQDDITLREVCGNTVRNVTSSPTSGIDPAQPFDVSPYAQATFEYFLRNPICQEMGRKFKISFSSSDADTAFSYIHDIGVIPKLNSNNERGFKVLVGGGLGAQPLLASIVEEFLPEDQLIPYIEAIIRVFDRHGERNNRNKARLKYLIQKIGLAEVLQLAENERKALKVKTFPINRDSVPAPAIPAASEIGEVIINNPLRYEQWLITNVFASAVCRSRNRSRSGRRWNRERWCRRHNADSGIRWACRGSVGAEWTTTGPSITRAKAGEKEDGRGRGPRRVGVMHPPRLFAPNAWS